jgi:hypothetical protein
VPRPIIALPAQVVALLQPKFYGKDYEHRLNKVHRLEAPEVIVDSSTLEIRPIEFCGPQHVRFVRGNLGD